MLYERIVKNFFRDWLAVIGALANVIFTGAAIVLSGVSSFTMNCRCIKMLYKIKCN